MQLGFYGQIVPKCTNIKFNENLLVGAELFHEGTGRRTDRHDVANSRFSQLCEGA